MSDLKFFAHYPFSDQAKEFVRKEQFQLDATSVSLGKERLRQALEDGKLKVISSNMESDLKSHLIAYASSRAILACWDNAYARARTAVCESKSAREYLNSQLDQQCGYDEFLAQSFGLNFIKNSQNQVEHSFKLAFYDYLRYCPLDIKYKLTNMELSAGFVKLTNAQRTRILEEAIRRKLETPIPKIKMQNQYISDAIVQLSAFLPKQKIEPSSISREDFAPCINKMLSDLQSSQNVAHSGRLSLAIYLIKAGLSDVQIVSVFEKAPDYNKETTAYQIKYIRNKEYTMPSCKTMQVYGLCVSDCNCGSPLRFKARFHSKNSINSQSKNEQERNYSQQTKSESITKNTDSKSSNQQSNSKTDEVE